MNALSADKKVQVISALVEGNSIRSIERMTGVHRDTIMRLALSVGEDCSRLLDRLIRKVRARSAEEGGKTPAVALTAYGRAQDRMLSLTAGYSMHVPKPVNPGELTTIIASVSGRALS